MRLGRFQHAVIGQDAHVVTQRGAQSPDQRHRAHALERTCQTRSPAADGSRPPRRNRLRPTVTRLHNAAAHRSPDSTHTHFPHPPDDASQYASIGAIRLHSRIERGPLRASQRAPHWSGMSEDTDSQRSIASSDRCDLFARRVARRMAQTRGETASGPRRERRGYRTPAAVESTLRCRARFPMRVRTHAGRRRSGRLVDDAMESSPADTWRRTDSA